MKVQGFLLIITVTILVAVLGLLLFNNKNGELKVISLGSIKITAEVADTQAERTKGLSGRADMPKDHGMLFVFEKKDLHQFWMKDMKFDLDFIWLDGKKIVDITQKVVSPKSDEPPVVITPRVPMDGVLEINAGVAGRSGVKIGEEINIEK